MGRRAVSLSKISFRRATAKTIWARNLVKVSLDRSIALDVPSPEMSSPKNGSLTQKKPKNPFFGKKPKPQISKPMNFREKCFKQKLLGRGDFIMKIFFWGLWGQNLGGSIFEVGTLIFFLLFVISSDLIELGTQIWCQMIKGAKHYISSSYTPPPKMLSFSLK